MKSETRRRHGRRRLPGGLVLSATLLLLVPVQLAWPAAAWALSEIGSDPPSPQPGGDDQEEPQGDPLPLPGPAEAAPGDADGSAGNEATRPNIEPDGPLPG